MVNIFVLVLTIKGETFVDDSPFFVDNFPKIML